MKISAEEKKEIIIQNFVSLLQQYGIEKVTLNDVAEKSGLTKSALYYYFDSKEALMIASLKKYRATMSEKLAVILSKAANPREKMKLYCDFLFDLPQDKDFSRIMTFSNSVIMEIAKYVVSVPAVASEIVNNKVEDLEKFTQMIAQYSGHDPNDMQMKKAALIFNAAVEEMLKYMFRVCYPDTSNNITDEFRKMSKEFMDIMKTMTKDEFSAFMLSGLDALVKTTYNDKN